MNRKMVSLGIIGFILLMNLSSVVLADNSNLSGIDSEHDLKSFSFIEIENIVGDLYLDNDFSDNSTRNVHNLYNQFQELYEVNETVSDEVYAEFKHADIANITIVNETTGNNTIVIQTYGDIESSEYDTIFFIWCDIAENPFYIVIIHANEGDDDDDVYIGQRAGDTSTDFLMGWSVYPNSSALEIEFPSEWWDETNTDGELLLVSITGDESDDIIIVDLYPYNDSTITWIEVYWIYILILLIGTISIISMYYYIKRKGDRNGRK